MNELIKRPIISYTEFEKLEWSSEKPLPKIGEEVFVRINGIGKAIVEKYFVENGFIGLIVKPTNPPRWYVRQNGKETSCHVFGSELREGMK